MSPQARGADVGLVTGTAGERSLVGVQSFVKFEMHKLGESGTTIFAAKGLIA